MAHYQATGKRTLLDVALKNADLLTRDFGPGGGSTRRATRRSRSAWSSSYRATGERKYLDLARFFLDQRGNAAGARALRRLQPGPRCRSSSRPRRSATRCARATCTRRWRTSRRSPATRRYVRRPRPRSGRTSSAASSTSPAASAPGARARPSATTTSCRTAPPTPRPAPPSPTRCGTTGMFLLHGDAKYLDVLERIALQRLPLRRVARRRPLLLPEPAGLDGTPRVQPGQKGRSEWFDCSCCPTNVVRFLPSIAGYVYAQRGADVFVNLFVAGRGELTLDGGLRVRLRQETRYPWDGAVRITLEPERARGARPARARPGLGAGPARCRATSTATRTPATEPFRLAVNGRAPDARDRAGLRRPAASLEERATRSTLVLPMPVRRVLGHDKVAADRRPRGPRAGAGRLLRRGGGQRRGRLQPRPARRRAARGPAARRPAGRRDGPRGPGPGARAAEDGRSVVTREQDFVAVPYYAWAHRARARWRSGSRDGCRSTSVCPEPAKRRRSTFVTRGARLLLASRMPVAAMLAQPRGLISRDPGAGRGPPDHSKSMTYRPSRIRASFSPSSRWRSTRAATTRGWSAGT